MLFGSVSVPDAFQRFADGEVFHERGCRMPGCAVNLIDRGEPTRKRL